jgi:hypothetical protein
MGFTDIEPIFVVGAPRSGTTLLQLILNAHPDVAIHGEIHFFDEILQLKTEIPGFETEQDRDKFLGQLGRTNALQYVPGLQPRLEVVRKRLGTAASPGYELFFLLLMQAFAEESGASRFGEKTPQNIRYLPELSEIFPEAKIVHIVRDPRDVVTSLMRMPWAPDSVVLNAIKWKIDMLYMHDYLESGGAAHELRYEDLVAEPESTLRALCRFLDVPWDPVMLAFNRSADANIQDEPWKAGTRRELNASAVSGWKNKLSPSEARVVQLATSPFLQHYGYEREPIRAAGVLRLPWTIAADAGRYIAGRLSAGKPAEATGEEGRIVGEEGRLRAKMAEAILKRKL